MLGIQEELDLGLSWTTQGVVSVGGTETKSIPLTLTNRGNGQEAFVLDAAIAGVDGTIDGFVVADASGNATGTQIARGGQTAALAPNQSITVLVLVHGIAATQGTLSVTAHAATGYGTPGTVFPTGGDNNTAAIVGPTSAAATLERGIIGAIGTNSIEPSVTLQKTQVVLASDGTANPIQGAQITYTLVAQASGAGTAAGAVVSDPIPDGTNYVAGSLTLDGNALPDTGNFDGTSVAVPIGNLVVGTPRTITFKVTVR